MGGLAGAVRMMQRGGRGRQVQTGVGCATRLQTSLEESIRVAGERPPWIPRSRYCRTMGVERGTRFYSLLSWSSWPPVLFYRHLVRRSYRRCRLSSPCQVLSVGQPRLTTLPPPPPPHSDPSFVVRPRRAHRRNGGSAAPLTEPTRSPGSGPRCAPRALTQAVRAAGHRPGWQQRTT